MFDLYLLFGQRKCSYPGQYEMEVLESCDYVTQDENPSFMKEKYDYYYQSKQFTHLRWISISIFRSAIEDQLFESKFSIHGEVNKDA